MVAEIICVGTEILLGNIVNTNATFLSEQLSGLGYSLYNQQVVGDNPDRLKEALGIALKRSDLIITSGGLGPTEDDLTKETIAELLGLRLVRNSESEKMLLERFSQLGHKMTENNWKQADVPEGARPLYNNNGTAPGIYVEKDGKTVVMLPGPPSELKPMFMESVYPLLEQQTGMVISSVMVKTCGVGESSAETMILDLIDTQTNPTIATYAKLGEVHIRVTAKAENREAADQLIGPVVKELEKRFGSHVYSLTDEVSLEDAICRKLIDSGKTISFAESCTGGLLCGRMINAAGVSAQLKESYVTYSDQAKEKILGVSHDSLEKYTAVSKEVAQEMAEGLCRVAGSDIGISVTGVAGPGPSEGKPAGLVYIGLCKKGETIVKQCQFYGNRDTVRSRSVVTALIMLWDALSKEEAICG